jgi:hypothetical protein
MDIYDVNTAEDLLRWRIGYLEKDHEHMYELLAGVMDAMKSQSEVILSQSETIANLINRDMLSASARVVERMGTMTR